MKNIALIFSLIIYLGTFAQDVITLKNGVDIKSKVLEVGIDVVKYKKYENIDGPTFIEPKSTILMIRYENGTKDIFSEPSKTEVENNYVSDKKLKDMFRRGQEDAVMYYKGYKPAGTGTLVTGLIASPLAGLIPAVACSSTSPDESNLMYPSSELFDDLDYRSGYTQKAKKIKSAKVWTNWGISFGVSFVVVLMLYN